MRQKRRSQRDHDEDDDGSVTGDLAAVTDRLDLLTRKLSRVAQTQERDERDERAPRRGPSQSRRDARDDFDDDNDSLEPAPQRRDPTIDKMAEVIARLDRRLDEVIAENRAASTQIERRVHAHEEERRAAAEELQRRAAAIADRERRIAAAEIETLSASADMQQRVAAAEMERRAARAAMEKAQDRGQERGPDRGYDESPKNWAMEISARQRALDHDDGALSFTESPAFAMQPASAIDAFPAADRYVEDDRRPASFAEPMPEPRRAAVAYRDEPIPAAIHHDRRADAPPAIANAYADRRNVAPDLSGLENQLRTITHQIASLQQPYEDALSTLRADLAEIGRSLTDALPRRAVEALEGEVRSLAQRVDQSRQAGINAPSLANLEQGLAEIRDSLRTLTPAENLVGVDEAVRALSRKIDQMSSHRTDAGSFEQIEHAITSLRGVVSNVASDGALAQLAAEVHNLARNFEHAGRNDHGSEAFARLDARIAALADNGRAIPPDLEATIRTLSDRLERMQLSQGDQFALGSLEDRIVKLVEKLDASDARLGSLGAIERGVTDLLVAVEDLRSGGAARGLRAAPAEPARHEPVRHEPAMPAAGQLQLPAGALSAIPDAAPQRPQPQPAQPQVQRRPQAAPQPARPAAATDLAFDAPLEPGSGAPRGRPASAAARIAASEAALPAQRRATAETGAQTAAAARSAAMSAIADAPAPAPTAKAKKAAAKANPIPPVAVAAEDDPLAQPAVPLTQRVRKHGKTLLVAASVVVIVLGVLQAAMDYVLTPSSPDAAATAPRPDPVPPADPARSGRSMPVPGSSSVPADPEPIGSLGAAGSIFDPNSILSRTPAADVTGSIARPGSKTATATGPVAPAASANLPASFGPVLRERAAANDPGAEYEIAMRYAEGRGVTRSADETVRWLERAAGKSFAPAQFRLASMNEKGEGVRKDLAAARRLYTAAAEQGHAKAMHNLAVLHAEGMDGKPDYKVATHWFRKAAAHGVADSQYNLAILFARGIGVEQNLSESHKWFSLAATRGDADAAKKRDEVGARLDAATLAAAKLAAQNAVTEREPEEAVSLRVPVGGWDRTATAQPVRTRPKAATNP